MKYKLTIESDDVKEIDRTLKATDLWLALMDFQEDTLRRIRKCEPLTDDAYHLFERIDREFASKLNKFDINLWELGE